MIHNDTELQTTQARIAKFWQWLQDMRQTTPPPESSKEQFLAMSSGYRLEIERMQAAVLDYLLSPAFIPADASQSSQAA